jgi:hypothetical protein
VLAHPRVPGPEQTGADGAIVRDSAPQAQFHAIQRLLVESPKWSRQPPRTGARAFRDCERPRHRLRRCCWGRGPALSPDRPFLGEQQHGVPYTLLTRSRTCLQVTAGISVARLADLSCADLGHVAAPITPKAAETTAEAPFPREAGRSPSVARYPTPSEGRPCRWGRSWLVAVLDLTVAGPVHHGSAPERCVGGGNGVAVKRASAFSSSS